MKTELKTRYKVFTAAKGKMLTIASGDSRTFAEELCMPLTADESLIEEWTLRKAEEWQAAHPETDPETTEEEES